MPLPSAPIKPTVKVCFDLGYQDSDCGAKVFASLRRIVGNYGFPIKDAAIVVKVKPCNDWEDESEYTMQLQKDGMYCAEVKLCKGAAYRVKAVAMYKDYCGNGQTKDFTATIDG